MSKGGIELPKEIYEGIGGGDKVEITSFVVEELALGNIYKGTEYYGF